MTGFVLHKCFVKNVYKLMKLIEIRYKSIDVGSMVRHWEGGGGVISINTHDSLVHREHRLQWKTLKCLNVLNQLGASCTEIPGLWQFYTRSETLAGFPSKAANLTLALNWNIP